MRFLILVLLFSIKTGLSQNDSTFLDFSSYVILDSITITAKKQGFSVEEFIKIIQNDESLEKAFINLRFLSYNYVNDISFYKNNGNLKAYYKSKAIQHFMNKCQWMEIQEEKVFGNYFKNKNRLRYYTAKLYHRIFLVSTIPCTERKPIIEKKNSKRNSVMENRIAELKKLIYTPGKKASVPLIGQKTAIFDEKMIENYDFSISSALHSSGSEAYVFRASVKAAVNAIDPDATVVKYLEVYVEKGSFQVLSRNYKLKYNAGIYDFDIVMRVNLDHYQEKYIPTSIKYDGYWKILGQVKEECKFRFRITDFL